MTSKDGQNEPLKHHHHGAPITNRRKLEDTLCLPIEGQSKTSCDTVKNHILYRLRDIVYGLINRVLYFDEPAQRLFRSELEENEELRVIYESKRQERWRYRKDRKVRKALDESGEPPKGYRRISKRQIKDTNDDDGSKV